MLFVLIGFAAGILSGLFGIGGGVVIVPALVLLADFQQKRATGTSLAALLLPVGALGAWVYWKDGNIDLKAAGFVALGLALGVFFGAKLVQHIDATTLRRFFAVFLALVAVKVWFS
ncbi:MAG: sulfite exporter TauE/SafE family protein [Gemmatimonadetes bacterium]|nr:sulfite exporter TauE/SafE family protein [Gemmatimonadota bacterium]